MRGSVTTATVALVLLVSGCTGSASPTPSPSTTATSSASTSPSPTSDRDRAEASARKAVDGYYRVLDEVASDPDVPIARLDGALSGDYLAAWRSELEKNRANGWTQSGSTQLVEVTTQGVDANAGSTSASVVFDVCYDVSATDVVDASGESVIPADRSDRGWERLTLTNADFANDPDGGWRVTAGETLEKEPCAGS